MSCPHTEQDVMAYLDGELDLTSALAFERHLEACPDCARALAAQRALREAIARRGPALPPLAELTRRLRRAAAPEPASGPLAGARGGSRRSPPCCWWRSPPGAWGASGRPRPRRELRRRGGGEPRPLAPRRPPGRRGLDRSAHGQALVHRQARLLAGRRRPRGPGLPADRRTSRLSRPPPRRGADLSRRPPRDQRLHLAHRLRPGRIGLSTLPPLRARGSTSSTGRRAG